MLSNHGNEKNFLKKMNVNEERGEWIMREGVGFGDYVLASFGKNSQREWKIVKPTSRQWVRGRFYRWSTQGAPQSSTDGERANHCKRKINTITMDKHATDRRAHTRGHGDGRGGGGGWGGGRKLSRHPTPPRPASKAPRRLIKLRITNSDIKGMIFQLLFSLPARDVLLSGRARSRRWRSSHVITRWP